MIDKEAMMTPIKALSPRPPATDYQTLQWKVVDRTDHIWYHRGKDYLCLLCGSVTDRPPAYPTKKLAPDWMPTTIEKLTEREREMVRDKYKLQPKQ